MIGESCRGGSGVSASGIDYISIKSVSTTGMIDSCTCSGGGERNG